MRPRRVEHAEERMDEAEHDPRVLEASLRHVAQANRWLGGWPALRSALAALLPPEGGSVLDIGAGSGDGAVVIARWARRAGRRVRVVAADVHPQMLEVARRRAAPFPEVRVERADALALPHADGAFDVAVMTVTLHHLEGEDAVRALREMARVASRGIIVGELERSWANYAGARLLSWTHWRRNPITRHDGPLSVLRAYAPEEMLEIARRAGLRGARVERRHFQRLLLTAEGGAAGPPA